MISIEEKMMEKGIRREELDEFARMDNHNGKWDKLDLLMSANNWSDIQGKDNFQYTLAKVLSEIGKDNPDGLKLMISDEQRKYLEKEGKYDLYTAQRAVFMLLGIPKYKKYGTREIVGLDRLYQDAIGGSK